MPIIGQKTGQGDFDKDKSAQISAELKGLTNVIKQLNSTLENFDKLSRKAEISSNSFIKSFNEVAKSLSRDLEKKYLSAGSVTKQFKKDFEDLFENLFDFSSRSADLFNTLGEELSEIAQKHSKVYIDNNNTIAQLLEDQSEQIAQNIGNIYKSTEEDLLNLVNKITQELKDPKKDPKQIFGSVLKDLKQKSAETVDKIEQSIKDALKNLKLSNEEIQNIVDVATLNIKRKYAQMAEAVENTMEQMTEKIKREQEEAFENLQNLFKWANIISGAIYGYGGLRAYAELQHQVALTARQMGADSVNVDELTQKLQALGIQAEIGAERFVELTTKLAKLRIINLENAEQSKEFIKTLGQYTQAFEVNAETVMEFMRESKFLFGLQSKDLERATKNAMEYMSAVGLTSQEMEGAWKDMTISLGRISEALVKVDASGKVVFDSKRYERATKDVAKLSAMFAKLGIEAGKAGEMINNMLDVERIGENAFALSQLGISIADVMNAPERAIEQLMNNLPALAQQLAYMDNYTRQLYLKNFEGLLPKEVLQKLRTGSLAEMNKAIQDMQKPINKVWEKTKQDLSDLWQMIQNVGKSILSMLHPIIPPLMKMAEILLWVFEQIGKALEKKWVQHLIQAIVIGLIGGRIVGGLTNSIGVLIKGFAALKQIGIGSGLLQLLFGKTAGTGLMTLGQKVLMPFLGGLTKIILSGFKLIGSLLTAGPLPVLFGTLIIGAIIAALSSKKIRDMIRNAIKKIANVLGKIFAPIIEAVWNTIKPLWNAVKTILNSFKQIGNALKDLFSGKISFKDFIKVLGNAVWNIVKSLVKIIFNIFFFFPIMIVNFIKNLTGKGKKESQRIKDLIMTFLKIVFFPLFLYGQIKNLFKKKGKTEKAPKESVTSPVTEVAKTSKEEAEKIKKTKTEEEKTKITEQVKTQKIQEKLLEETQKIKDHTGKQVETQKEHISVTAKVKDEIKKLKEKEKGAIVNYETMVNMARTAGGGAVGALKVGFAG